MAITYSEAYNLAIDSVFLGRLIPAMTKYAETISGEANTVAGHATRAAFAARVLQDPESWKQKFAYAVCSTTAFIALTSPVTPGSTSTNPTDAQIDAAVSAVWNGIAGFYAN